MRFPGSLGIRILRPPGNPGAAHEAVFFFTTREHLAAWEASPERQAWLRKAEPFTEGEPDFRISTGLEFFFIPPEAGATLSATGTVGGPGPTPARPPAWKQACVVMLAVYPCTLVASLILHPVVHNWPYWLATFARSGTVVLMMTYGVLPCLTRLLSPWLYGPRKV